MKRHLLALAIAAITPAGVGCERPARAPTTPPPPAPSGAAIDPDAQLAVISDEVSFTAGGRAIPGTLVRPAEGGPWPAVLILAGSGPTDRDWDSPLLPAHNGSGKLLAEALAARGAVVLRFDKTASGKNPGPPLAALRLDTYRDEAAAALALLRARADVRIDRVFVAGHSEGGIHAARLAAAAPGELAGVLYLSSAARTMAATILTQIEGNLRDAARMPPAEIERHMAPLRRAVDDFLAGRPVDPAQASELPPLRQLVASMVAPAAQPLMRDLLGFDPAAAAATLDLPALVLVGGKDVQIDPELDGRVLERALRDAGRAVTFHVSPDADHVLKHEPRPFPELRADLQSVQAGYNAEGRALDADVVATIVGWLAEHTSPGL